MRMNILGFLALFLAALGTSTALDGIACENQVLSLRCSGGNVLRIMKAIYGRQGRQHCNRNPIRSLSCGRPVTDIVSSICQDRESCQVESKNALFGDPCPGTVKYLHVKYQCVDPELTVAIACEGGQVTLNCPVKTGIVIYRANYGRTGRHTCNRNPIESLNCYALNTDDILQNRCAGRRTCTVGATNGVFGDPCHGTVKYLQVHYGCEFKQNTS